MKRFAVLLALLSFPAIAIAQNECANSQNTGLGSNMIAIQNNRDFAGIVHQTMCYPTNNLNINGILYPQRIEVDGQNSTGGLFIMSNQSGLNRTNTINFRACNGPGATNCGTDFQFAEDPTNSGYEEYEFKLIGGNNPLYFGNRLNSLHPGIYLGSSDARTTGFFGLDNVAGSIDHFVRLSADTDMWSTATLASGTVSVTFTRAFASTPICIATWQGTGTLTGILKCTPTTTGITIASSVGTDTAVVAYLILGNNN